MDLSARITGIRYKPFLGSELKSFDFSDLTQETFSNSAFMLNTDGANSVAVSWWVSAKRTRSYPYARVYDTLSFSGKRITIIPVFKDEGRQGDRDFLQWDTVSLMSLLGVYVIIAYYAYAERNVRYRHKITNQRFDISYLQEKIDEILSYQSDALHWNLEQVGNIAEVAQIALDSYGAISKRLHVDMHSRTIAEKRSERLSRGGESFKALSRGLAEAAQRRETVILQPKERVSGIKGNLTIQNHLGGYYYLTLDEVRVVGQDIHLIEAKHTRKSILPSANDIKDALIKMILFTNLKDVTLEGKSYNPKPILKLTSEIPFDPEALNSTRRRFWESLINCEATVNGYTVRQE